MTTSDEGCKAFDFSMPCRLDVAIENRMLDWQRTACKLLPDKWSNFFKFAAPWTPLKLETISTASYELPANIQAYSVGFEGHMQRTLLGFPPALSLGLVEGVLGGTPTEMPDSRLLTQIEFSLLEVVLQILLEAVNEAAVSCGLPTCELQGRESTPHLIRLFPGDEELVMLTVRIEMPFGEQELFWIWPEPLAHELFPADLGQATTTVVKDELQQLAKRIPLDLSIRLGEVEIDVADLAGIRVGDVIVLDQRVSEPLKCFLCEQLFLEAWPGQQNARRAIQVHRVVDA